MRLRVPMRGWLRRLLFWAGVCAISGAGVVVAVWAAPDQPVGDAVGVIEGEDIAVTGPMSVEVVGGQTKTILRSGSDVRVKSGRARISLQEGGQISICGPAHLSVLKAGGSVTVALESGVIHARLEREPGLTFYTAQIQAQTVAIGDEPRDMLVGFESSGVMCIRANRGAMRLENQLSGQSVMVPQGGDILLTNGQIESLRNGAGHCSCELQIAKAPAIPAPATPVSAAVAANGDRGTAETDQVSSSAVPTDEKPPPKEEPVFQVFLPPLRFDANAKVQPEPDPRLMVLVRRVRVRPTLIFQGRVEGEPAPSVAAAPPQPRAAPVQAATPPPTPGVADRVKSFFRRLWSGGS